MIVKHIALIPVILFLAGMPQIANADNKCGSSEKMMHHDMKHAMDDGRVSLGMPPEMKQHQLTNMRAHLVAVQDIVGLIAEQDFEKASEVAYSRLGLTEEMKSMCMMFKNDEFKELGLTFHKSGDDLGDALKTGDTAKSLVALQKMLGYCTQCHAAFRQ